MSLRYFAILGFGLEGFGGFWGLLILKGKFRVECGRSWGSLELLGVYGGSLGFRTLTERASLQAQTHSILEA